MSKVAAYLRGHISGEVSTREDVREALSNDMGALSIKPELVVYPRTTNDIRKVARFAWQLAEKNHILPLTVRGAGTDSTGAAIGKGAAIVTTAHLNKVFEFDTKQKLVRLQPGASVGALQSALALHGTSVLALFGAQNYGTVGGAVASAVGGPLAGKYGTIAQAIDQLEVVLANGDVLQTGRINKRELSKRKGLQGFVGDIYRGVDGVIEEYADVLSKIELNDITGYSSVADVKRKDGSFDLTPLFVGSQGTLGFISEMILKADFRSTRMGVCALVFADGNAARDALDSLANQKPAILEYFDAALFDVALRAGRTYKFYTQASEKFAPESVVIVAFDEFNNHQRTKNLKKVAKLYEKREGVAFVSDDPESESDLLEALEVAHYTLAPDQAGVGSSDLFGGFYIPTARLEDFMSALKTLGEHEHIALPLAGHAVTNTYTVYPSFALHKVGDKQKLFKLIDSLTKLIYEHGGVVIAEGGEGRLKAHAVYANIDSRAVEMFTAIRKVFDPYGTLNPGVKQANDIRALATQLQDGSDRAGIARFGV